LKRFLLLSILGSCWLAVLPAQMAAEMETLLETQAVSYAQAARFVLEAAEAATIADPAEAVRFAQENSWLPNDIDPETPARLDVLSLLFMQSFNLKGGIIYSFVKSPHYAYRELVYRQAIQGRADPEMTVSGHQLIFITNKLMEEKQ